MPSSWDGLSDVVVTVPAFAEGNYQVTATLTDTAGNQSPDSNTVPFTFNKEDEPEPLQAPVIDVIENNQTLIWFLKMLGMVYNSA